MKIYTPEECERWIKHKTIYGSPFIQCIFTPYYKENDNELLIGDILVADMERKSFNHNINRIKNNVNKICKNYPKLNELLDNINIYICPKPAMNFCNAEVWGDKNIIFYARTTQIPNCMTDYIIAHEFGHIVQKLLCKESHYINRGNKFREYLKIRNCPKDIFKDQWVKYDKVSDKDFYEDIEDYICLHSDHKDYSNDWDKLVTEWFAEDFRYFFGVDTGEPYWGLPIPEPNEEIKEFMLNL